MGTETTDEAMQHQSADGLPDWACATCRGTGRSMTEFGECHMCKGTARARAPEPVPAKIELQKVEAERAPEALPARIAYGLFRAQCAIGHLEKDARNAEDGYDYTSAESVIARAGAVLREEGLLPIVVDVSPEDAAGRIDVTLRLIHVESGQHWTSRRRVHVDAERTGRDKAESGSETLAISYWYRGVLMFGRGAVDVNARGDRRPREPQRPQASEPRQAPPSSRGRATSKAADDVVVNALASEVQSTKTVAELEEVAKRFRAAIRRREIRPRDQGPLGELIEEQRLRVTANDAARDAEGPQAGAAA